MQTERDADDRGVGLLVSPVRRALVDMLSAHRPEPDAPQGITAAAMAAELELHVSTVRFHLDQLVAAGLLEAEFTSKFGVGRPRKIYRVAPGSLAVDRTGEREDEAMRMLATLLAESYSTGLSPAEAGRQWAHNHVEQLDEPAAQTAGQWLGKIGRMVDVLEEWGYTSELTTTDGGRTARVDLHHCPFLELASTSPAVVCGLHRGLIAGALDQLGEGEADVSLEPFVGPDRCQAHITTNAEFRPRKS